MIKLNKGRICWFDNASGHFRPNNKSLEKVTQIMNKLRDKHPELFTNNYEGAKNYE